MKECMIVNGINKNFTRGRRLTSKDFEQMVFCENIKAEQKMDSTLNSFKSSLKKGERMQNTNFDYNSAVIEQLKTITVDAIFCDKNGVKHNGSIKYSIKNSKETTVEMQTQVSYSMQIPFVRSRIITITAPIQSIEILYR